MGQSNPWGSKGTASGTTRCRVSKGLGEVFEGFLTLTPGEGVSKDPRQSVSLLLGHRACVDILGPHLTAAVSVFQLRLVQNQQPQ